MRDSFRHAKKLSIIPAFLPPTSQETLRDDVSEQLKKFELIIATNAYSRGLYDSKEIYGIDTICEAIQLLDEQILAKKIPNLSKRVGLIFFDPSNAYDNYPAIENQCCNSIKLLRFTGNDLSFFELLKQSDICIRATRTDGDPLSIREAIHLGVEVVASNASDRPASVKTFETGDPISLAEVLHSTVLQALNNDNSKTENSNSPSQNYYEDIVQVYLT